MPAELSQRFATVAAHMNAVAADADYLQRVERGVELLCAALSAGHKVLVFGNGGSAADAQHFAAELAGRFLVDRKALPVLALTTNTSALTAIANDFSFADIFSRQIEAYGQPGDVAIGISTSGASPNVVNGLKHARELGLETVALTGSDSSALAEHCDVLMAVPLTNTARIQEVHLVTYHTICELVERRLFGNE